jgi:deoxyadenosine/deoxycytidine kinase
VVYLRASVPTLVARIARRGRDYERQISPEYLGQLNELYEAWIASFSQCPVLTVPSDDLDYVSNSGHLDLIVEKVQEKLTGKEEVIFDLEDMSRFS